jgi:hypothetical protein
MTRSVLFLLGMPDSGASALAAALAAAGGRLGAAANPVPGDTAGAGANSALAALSDTVLGRLGLGWDSLAAPPERWAESAAARTLAPAAAELVLTEFGTAATAVVAESRACRLFPFWRGAFEAAGFKVSAVLLARHPREVAAALARRLQFAPEKSLALWLAHLVDAEHGSRGLRRVLVTHDALAADPAATLNRIAGEAAFPLAAAATGDPALAALASTPRQQVQDRPAGGIGSGLDAALDDGYVRLAALPSGTDPRREIEALAATARGALTAAIAPWLVAELETARHATQRIAGELDAARQRHEELARELAREKARVVPDPHVVLEQLEALRAERAREREALLMQLEGTRGELARLSSVVADAPRAEASLRLELAQTHRDLVDERGAIQRLTDEIETMRRDAEGTAQRFESARYHLEALATELAQTREALQSRERESDYLADEVDGLRMQMADRQAERDAMRKERNDAQHQLGLVSAECEGARRELAAAITERDALTHVVRENGEAIAALRDELPRRAAAEAALARERDRLTAELRAAAARIARLETEAAERAAYVTELTTRHNQMAARLNELDQRTLVRAAVWMGGRPQTR